MTSSEPDSGLANAVFATTRWSIILSAGQQSSPDAENALETLCQTYWYPLYAFARRRGSSPEDAADLTQEFFARLLEKEYLLAADREKGRFRSFLLTMFKRFLSKERDRAHAQKRGGGWRRLPIDIQDGEQRYGYEPTDDWTPEALFERRWALTLLERVIDALQRDYEAKGKGELFHLCKPFLTGSGAGPPYEDIARRLQMNETAVRVAVHRLRERYREMLKQEVAQTISEADSVDDELNHLRSALRGKLR